MREGSDHAASLFSYTRALIRVIPGHYLNKAAFQRLISTSRSDPGLPCHQHLSAPGANGEGQRGRTARNAAIVPQCKRRTVSAFFASLKSLFDSIVRKKRFGFLRSAASATSTARCSSNSAESYRLGAWEAHQYPRHYGRQGHRVVQFAISKWSWRGSIAQAPGRKGGFEGKAKKLSANKIRAS